MIPKPATLRRAQIQEIRTVFEIKRQATQDNLIYTQTVISKPHGKYKPKHYNIYKKKKERESNPDITLKMSSNHERKEQRRKERKKTYKNKPKTIKKMAIGTYISIITLNVNGLNALTKRH